MNTADLAIVAVLALGLADGYWHHRFRMGVADRVRVVNPAKPPQQQTRGTEADAPKAPAASAGEAEIMAHVLRNAG